MWEIDVKTSAADYRANYFGNVAKNVANDPHGRHWRVDVSVADHEFLQNVVLDGSLQ